MKINNHCLQAMMFAITIILLSTSYAHAQTLEFGSSIATSQMTSANHTAIPEFPFAVPILFASFVSVIVFYRMSFGK